MTCELSRSSFPLVKFGRHRLDARDGPSMEPRSGRRVSPFDIAQPLSSVAFKFNNLRRWSAQPQILPAIKNFIPATISLAFTSNTNARMLWCRSTVRETYEQGRGMNYLESPLIAARKIVPAPINIAANPKPATGETADQRTPTDTLESRLPIPFTAPNIPKPTPRILSGTNSAARDGLAPFALPRKALQL